ncbi:hypothetical protein CIPAW_06G139200 [Carya illinoinensis]|uniref:Uncharacterized protein n=1 Tax=Carya illinoinensis TaxID=32201 RepID=A0A8T1QC07_CARIL|nr:hypothetical protein CIPAW_06G139200 [Carya illinoinensis]
MSAPVVIWTRELAKLREKGTRTIISNGSDLAKPESSHSVHDQPKEAAAGTSTGLVQAFGLWFKRVLNPLVVLPCSEASVSMVVDYCSA